MCSGEKTALCERLARWLWVLSVTLGGLMVRFCRCVPLQEMVLSTPGALQASSAPPVAMALVKSCPPSLHHPLEGTWEWEAASQTYGFSSLRQAKGWCPHWWVGNTWQHNNLKCVCYRADLNLVSLFVHAYQHKRPVSSAVTSITCAALVRLPLSAKEGLVYAWIWAKLFQTLASGCF